MENEEFVNKKRKFKCPLFISIGISMLVLSMVGIWYVYYAGYEMKLSLNHPIFAAILLNEKAVVYEEEVYDESGVHLGDEEMVELNDSVINESDITNVEADMSGDSTKLGMAEENVDIQAVEQIDEEEENRRKKRYLEEYGEEPFRLSSDDDTWYVHWNNNDSRSIYYVNSPVRPVSTPYSYKQVDASYYANSVFIGDSRIAGLHDYSGWEDTTFCYKVGLNIYDMMTDTIRTNDGKSTVEDVLSSKQFENVYIMIGINELGIGTVSDFANEYKEKIDIIRSLQPNARIIIMAIMFETKEYSDAEDVYNNDNINAKNAAIARLSNGEDIFFLDMNPAVTDESGGVREDISFDGVHLTAKYYYLWTDFMYSHGY